MADTNPDYAALTARLDALEAENKALRSAVPPKPKAPVKLTGSNTHRATMRGYAIPVATDANPQPAGVLVGPQDDTDIVPAGVPVSTEWMEPIKKGVSGLAAAVDEAQAEHPSDVDLTQLSKAALEAMAAERGINVAGLSKADLITAIKAEREPTI